MKAKKGQFKAAGIYHQILVKILPQKKMNKYLEDEGTLACYEHADAIIHVTRELSPEVKRHAFYHEIAHHIIDTLSDVRSVETKCDLLGAYIMKLLDENEKVKEELSK